MKALLIKDLTALKSSLKLFLAATAVYFLLFFKESPETVVMVLTLMTFFLNLNSLNREVLLDRLPLLLLGLGLMLAFPQMDFTEYCVTGLAMMGALMLMQAAALPVSLKWGTEKGRLMLLIFFGLGALAMMFGGSRAEQQLEQFLSRPTLLSTLAWLAPAAVAAAFAASYFLSIRIMERKEF